MCRRCKQSRLSFERSRSIKGRRGISRWGIWSAFYGDQCKIILSSSICFTLLRLVDFFLSWRRNKMWMSARPLYLSFALSCRNLLLLVLEAARLQVCLVEERTGTHLVISYIWTFDNIYRVIVCIKISTEGDLANSKSRTDEYTSGKKGKVYNPLTSKRKMCMILWQASKNFSTFVEDAWLSLFFLLC